MKRKLLIAVAPNGARKTRNDHPHLPLTPAQLAHTAEQCLHAGAAMMHLHVRDDNAQHSLSSEHYNNAIAAIKDAVGDEMLIQITTESTGKFSLQEQMDCVIQTQPEAFSLALCEFFPDGDDDARDKVKKFLNAQHAAGVWMQFILYQPTEVKKIFKLRDRGFIPGNTHSFLFVANRQPNPASLPDFQNALNATGETNHQWMSCAFNETELPTTKHAITTDGDVRIGMENNHHTPDNATSVTQTATLAAQASRPLLSAAELREVIAQTYPPTT